MILCELISEIQCVAVPPEVARDSPNDPDVALRNLSVALSMIKTLDPPKRISELVAKRLYESDEAIYELLEFLRSRSASGKGELEDAYLSISEVAQPKAQTPLEPRLVSPIPEPAQPSRATPRLNQTCSPQEDRPLQMVRMTRPMDASETREEEPKVDPRTKAKLLGWLEDISLIKKNAVDALVFPGYCRNGVLFSDLILRLEGVLLAIRLMRDRDRRS